MRNDFFAVLLQPSKTAVEPGLGAYLFCGFALALSVIAPGMSFSTLLMPLGLYTPFVEGIGHLRPEVLIPGMTGCVVTFVCLARLVNRLLEKQYAGMFHGISGIISAATVMRFHGTVLPHLRRPHPGICSAWRQESWRHFFWKL